MRPRLWRCAALAGALAFGLGSGGCSLSYQFENYFSGDKSDVTGSIGSDASKKSELPPESDLVYARAAASEVLRRGQIDASLPWENPASGARGTITPIASAYTQNGLTCRDFLASYVAGQSETWLQGEACKRKGAWEVRSIKPWKRT